MTPNNTSSGALVGKRVLVIEDEALVGLLIEDVLVELGCELAGRASRLEEALEKAKSLPFEIAILDVNLNGQPTFPVADVLIQRRLPFVFATGYGPAGIPAAMQTVPILHKPFQQSELEKALLAALSAEPTPRPD